MMNKNSFIINCPMITILYIHNVEGYVIKCYKSSDYAFAIISETCINRVISFGNNEGKGVFVILLKIISSHLLEINQKLYFSYYNDDKNDDVAFVYLCSNPNKTVIVSQSNITTNPEIDLFELDDSKNRNNILWFTFPFEVELKMKKILPNIHNIFRNGDFDQFYEDDFTITGKEFLFRIDYESTIYSSVTEFKVQPKNINYLQKFKNYHISNGYVFIKGFDVLKFIHEEESVKDIYDTVDGDDDDYSTVIIIIICVVVGAVVIVVIVVVVVVIKKRKKKKVQNNSSD